MSNRASRLLPMPSSTVKERTTKVKVAGNLCVGMRACACMCRVFVAKLGYKALRHESGGTSAKSTNVCDEYG